MKVIQTAPRSGSLLAIAIVWLIGCALPRDQREIAAADAETFETIVRSQLSDSVSTGFLRVDSRPAGDKDILTGGPITAGLDPDSSADTVAEGTGNVIARQRKNILRDLQIEEGGPFVFPECGGFRTRRFRDSSAVHPDPKCPPVYRRYVTGSIPTRGESPVLSRARRPESPPPDTTRELWTVLVTESSVGPGGQQWRQYAWLFHRDPAAGRLSPADRLLLSWPE